MPCHFYILLSEQDESYYIGYTCDELEERVAKHNRPHKGYTGRKQPWGLVYSEMYPTKSEAMAREREVKSWRSRKKIESLIASETENPGSSAG